MDEAQSSMVPQVSCQPATSPVCHCTPIFSGNKLENLIHLGKNGDE